MAQIAGPLDGTNVSHDYHFTAGTRILANSGIVSAGDLAVTLNSVAAGEALIECTRTNGEKVTVLYRNTASVTIDTSGTKKVYVLVDQAKLDDGSANSADGTGIAAIATGASYPSGNYIPLASITTGTITDARELVTLKAVFRKGLTGSRLLVTDANGKEAYVTPGALNSYLAEDLTFKPLASALPIFGGSGVDGAVTGALTITGSNNTVIVKNYTNFAPGANSVTITPTGCVTIIKVSGNLDLTGSTINWAGKGMPGASSPGTGNGTSGSAQAKSFPKSTAATGGGGNNNLGGGGGGAGGAWITAAGANGWSGTNGGGGTAGTLSTYVGGFDFIRETGQVFQFVAEGGGSGGWDLGGAGAAGGAGGAGGGTVIFEVAGNVTFSGTTVTVAGTNWSVGGSAAGNGGGGGGGGGGLFVVAYKGTLSGSVTPTVTGGNGGNSGGGIAGGAGGGEWVAGTAGTNGGTSGGGGGGAGGGTYSIVKVA